MARPSAADELVAAGAEVLDPVAVLLAVLDDVLDEAKAAITGDPPALFPLAESYG